MANTPEPEIDIVRSHYILPQLRAILYEFIQTQDIFLIRFQPQFSECDFSIYEFKNYTDIRNGVKRKLDEYIFDDRIKQLIVHNLDLNSQQIQCNIDYFGVPHFWSIYK